jgi:pyruvate ferredoxin oxidoreductase gamma subunit
VPELTEIRWHARAGQGAKTASNILALALLRNGKSVQSFPEYGPERRGAPLRAYTRFSNARVRRHDAIDEPDLVVVLDDTLLEEPAVREGVSSETRMLVVPAGRFATAQTNVAMLGAVAAELGEPPLEALQDAIVETLGAKAEPEALRAAAAEGYRWRS